MKKLIVLSLLLGLAAIVGVGGVFASDEEVKPWESMMRFRGNEKLSASESGMNKDEFFALRDAEKEVHRAERMQMREERLLEAVKRGCITEEEMEEKLLQRKGRFQK